MLLNAQQPPMKMRLYATMLAYSVNLLFGTFLLANNLGIWYYHFYALEIVNIVILYPFCDLAIWGISAIVVIVGTLARVAQSRQSRSGLDRKSVV